MLADWLRGGSKQPEVENAQPKERSRMNVDPEHIAASPTDAEKKASRSDAIQKKIQNSLKDGPPHPQNLVAYDSMFRSASSLLMDGNNAETNEGLAVNLSRNAQNTMISSKWQMGNPQTSNWEVSLQMNGFNDICAVTYSTMNRLQLMYQRMFRSGALGVAQFMQQTQGQMSMGTFFGMIQYPWVNGGCSQLQYIKQQNVTLSHMQRLIRGVYVGSSLTYDSNTHSTTASYGFCATNPTKTASFAGEVKPASGEWKLAYTRSDWASDTEFATQLEFTEKRNGKISLLSMGVKKNMVGGGMINVVLSGFSKVRAALEIPFGGERAGFNQVQLAYNVQYDIYSGGLKHGIALTV